MERTAEIVAQELNLVIGQIKELSVTKLCLEAELADKVGSKDEGSQSVTAGNLRVTTVAKLNRSLVKNASIDDVKQVVGAEAAAKLFKTRHELVVSEYRKLSDKERYSLSHLIVAKPAKLAVKIEAKDKGE